MSRNYLSKNDELRKGDYLVSNNREFKAVFQEDGNFVIYGWKPIWASNTVAQEAQRLCMQDDCNFVMYDRDGSARWHTNTHRSGTNVCRVCLQDEGTLVVDVENEEVWTSAS